MSTYDYCLFDNKIVLNHKSFLQVGKRTKKSVALIWNVLSHKKFDKPNQMNAEP